VRIPGLPPVPIGIFKLLYLAKVSILGCDDVVITHGTPLSDAAPNHLLILHAAYVNR